ncbi:hypothetical protein LJK88_10225 [Paenibacillus sp. P26]|nr:hypothetical protein LJK88_10225 [Paenibacillus sp. P26]UUZ89789.1 hypothetical protein LJK87_27435 [Paenibacillus sp. P25]
MKNMDSVPIELDIMKIAAQLNLDPSAVQAVLQPNLNAPGSSTHTIPVKNT